MIREFPPRFLSNTTKIFFPHHSYPIKPTNSNTKNYIIKTKTIPHIVARSPNTTNKLTNGLSIKLLHYQTLNSKGAAKDL